MRLCDLKDGMRKINVVATVVEISAIRDVKSRYTDETYKVADAIIEDETGSVKLTLWNEDAARVRVSDRVRIENGYIKSFRDVLALNVGKYGVLTIE